MVMRIRFPPKSIPSPKESEIILRKWAHENLKLSNIEKVLGKDCRISINDINHMTDDMVEMGVQKHNKQTNLVIYFILEV